MARPSCWLRITIPFLAAWPFAMSAAPSFDCKLAHSAVEQLICADDRLGTLDREEVARYERLRRAVSPGGAALLLKKQRAWLAARQGCLAGSYTNDRASQVECLIQAYQEPPRPLDGAFRQASGLVLEYRESVRRIPRLRVTEDESHPWLTGQPAARAEAFNQYVTTRLSLDKGMFAQAPIQIDRPPEGDTEYERFYEIHHMDAKLISIEVYRHHSSYVGHGWRAEFGLNWDLRAGRPIKIASLFRPGTNWRDAVMTEVRKFVRTDDFTGDPDDIIRLADPEEDEGWLFEPDHAVLLVGGEERSMVGTAADVPIPYEVLAPLLLPDTPLPGHVKP